jgi:hypothetical protein
MGFVWFSLQTAIISLKNINQLIFVMVKNCFLCGTDWILKYYEDELRLQGVNMQYMNVYVWSPVVGI